MVNLRKLIFIFLIVFCIMLISCLDSITQRSEPRFKLYETNNVWTFIKLDTATGKMWQIQYVIEGDNRGGVELNSHDLSGGEQRIPGRFALYPTSNVWTFILLDQINGCSWQVQWSQEAGKRGIIGPIFKFR